MSHETSLQTTRLVLIASIVISSGLAGVSILRPAVDRMNSNDSSNGTARTAESNQRQTPSSAEFHPRSQQNITARPSHDVRMVLPEPPFHAETIAKQQLTTVSQPQSVPVETSPVPVPEQPSIVAESPSPTPVESQEFDSIVSSAVIDMTPAPASKFEFAETVSTLIGDTEDTAEATLPRLPEFSSEMVSLPELAPVRNPDSASRTKASLQDDTVFVLFPEPLENARADEPTVTESTFQEPTVIEPPAIEPALPEPALPEPAVPEPLPIQRPAIEPAVPEQAVIEPNALESPVPETSTTSPLLTGPTSAMLPGLMSDPGISDSGENAGVIFTAKDRFSATAEANGHDNTADGLSSMQPEEPPGIQAVSPATEVTWNDDPDIQPSEVKRIDESTAAALPQAAESPVLPDHSAIGREGNSGQNGSSVTRMRERMAQFLAPPSRPEFDRPDWIDDLGDSRERLTDAMAAAARSVTIPAPALSQGPPRNSAAQRKRQLAQHALGKQGHTNRGPQDSTAQPGISRRPFASSLPALTAPEWFGDVRNAAAEQSALSSHMLHRAASVIQFAARSKTVD